ncbi:MAG: 2-hydroxychromene-2-carboxylate isomerase [Comamonas sp.]
MKTIDFYLDFVSPYAWLAFHELPAALQGHSVHVRYTPVLLGALLSQHHNPGPAGIAGKREWTYRHVSWLGHSLGCGLSMPAQHPFNPLPLLRKALQTSLDGTINRYVADTIFRHVWLGGHDALDAARLIELDVQLAEQWQTDAAAAQRAKDLLRTNTDAALAAGIFGVPAMVVDGKSFWGLDGLPMLKSYLNGDAWFAGDDWENCVNRPSGLTRG